METRIRKGFVLTALILLLMPMTVWAQGTAGTIRGKVTDAGTGEPLAAVNIVVLDLEGNATTMGTMTNAQGDYVIINVVPGTYNLKASMMGYSDLIAEELRVLANVSTSQNFPMTPTVLDVTETITVEADREMIQRDVTGTQQTYTIEEMERMAVTTTSEILQLQTNIFIMEDMNSIIPGYRDRGLEQVHMRGGRNAEVAFMIDGMQVTNLVFGGQAAQVSPLSLSEMVVMAGGMSAEFGNAMSGVINFVTREGGARYTGQADFSTSTLSGQAQDIVRGANNLRANYGGPVPYAGRTLSFFLSGSLGQGVDYTIKKDDKVFHADIDPWDPDSYKPEIDYRGVTDQNNFGRLENGDNPYTQYEFERPDLQLHWLDVYSGWIGYGFDNSWNGMLNSTYRMGPAMKVTLSGQNNGRWATPFTHNWRMTMMWGFPQWFQDYLKWGFPRYDADDYPAYSSKIIPNIGRQGWHNEKNILFLNNNRLSFVFNHQLDQSTYYSVRGSYYGYNRTMRVQRWINDEGWVARREYAYPSSGTDTTYRFTDEMTKVTLGQFGYSSGLRDNVILYEDYDAYTRGYGYIGMHGAGLGYSGSDRYYTDHRDITRSLKADVTSQVTTHHQLKTGMQYNALTMDQYDLQLLYLDPPYIVDYRRSPWEYAAYLQDKIEYDFLILNIGVRFDASSAGDVPYWIDPRNVIDPLTGEVVKDPSNPEVAPLSAGTIKTAFSPRFGISHPVTDRAVVYFNYGHFYQNPVYRNVFLQGTLEDSVPLIGNPNMEQEKTVSYEIGLKNQFTDILALEATLWSRTSSNMVGSERVPSWFGGQANPYTYTVFLNYDYSIQRGVDVSLRKRFSNYWSGTMNYSTMTGESNRDDPWQGYRDGTLGQLDRQPKRATRLGWSVPHRVSANLSFSLPSGAGPALPYTEFHPFADTNFNLTMTASSGRPYTPTTIEGTLPANSGRMPAQYTANGRIYRQMTLMGQRVSLWANISNVFNRRNVVTVYPRTGKPDDPGPDASGYSDSYDRFYYYSPPRRIDLGIMVRF